MEPNKTVPKTRNKTKAWRRSLPTPGAFGNIKPEHKEEISRDLN